MSVDQTVRLDPDAGSYREEQQDHAYEHDQGLCVLPVAQATSKHRVIRLHGGYGMRRVTWSSARVGCPPMIPAAANTTGDTLLSATVVPSLPTIDKANDAYSWVVRGEYLYVQNAPRVAGENAFPAGNRPYLVLPQAQFGGDLIENYGDAIQQADNPDDALTEAVGDAYDTDLRGEDGSVFWPFTTVPAFLSSTHIIGG